MVSKDTGGVFVELFLNILLMVVSIALVVLGLMQSGKSEGIASALTGQSSALFVQTKERGPEVIMSRLTMVFGIAFFALAILIQLV